MVAYLQDGVVDDDRLPAKASEKPKPAGLPLTHEAALKWFYKDPQGEIQGEVFMKYKSLIGYLYIHNLLMELYRKFSLLGFRKNMFGTYKSSDVRTLKVVTPSL